MQSEQVNDDVLSAKIIKLEHAIREIQLDCKMLDVLTPKMIKLEEKIEQIELNYIVMSLVIAATAAFIFICRLA